MDQAEQDQYEARLMELFDSFDTTGTGSLGQEELTDLCHMLQLDEVAPSLQQALLQDNPHGRVHFDQFKEALILLLSSTLSNEESFQEPDCSPEVQPKYIKDGKRYGRRSMPELQDSLEEFDEVTVIEPECGDSRSSPLSGRNCEERWKSEDHEEYEADGQLRFWNPDDLHASQNVLSQQDWVEEKLQMICEDLAITRHSHFNRKKLITIFEQYGFQNLEKEALEDAFENLDQEDTMSLQDFFYEVYKITKPLTPSCSTPYRQLKRHISMQSFDESGRRTITPSSMTGAIGFRLLSKLDDGTGYGSVDDIIDLWHEEGIENSQSILKALDFNLEGNINLTELTMTLENELLITKNEVYHAALVSFRSEIRHLVERADQAAREKEKLRSDLEKNERFKTLMASEVDDHHAAIERRNEYNLRKLDEEYKEKTSTLKSELRKEREQILQQASKQRLDLEQELEKVKAEENYLRDRLTLSLKESSRLEKELLETTEKLLESETLASKLQRSLDNLLMEKFGDLDPSCAEFFRQEERLMQVRNEYERQRRELQDRIDELQLELEEYRAQGIKGFRSSLTSSLFDEIDNKNAVETDQGIGTEDCPPLNMSIEAEMAIEHMREQHQREVERLTMELESNATRYEEHLKEVKHLCEKEQDVSKQHFKEEIVKMEEQVRLLKMQHTQLEAEIITLKEEQKKTQCEHNEELVKLENTFNSHKALLQEKEAALQLKLDEAKRIYQEEKEEWTQKTVEMKNETEDTVAQLKKRFEDEKCNLEHDFLEQLEGLKERHQSQINGLRTELLEKHQHELQEERKKMEAEYNRRLSEMETQLHNNYELEMKKHEEALETLKRGFQDKLNELTEVHKRERSQWEWEKEEIVQAEIKNYEAAMENLERNFQSKIFDLKELHKEDRSQLESEKEEIMLSENQKHKELLENIERQFQNKMNEITNLHREEKSHWEFEKKEMIQEYIEEQHKLQEMLVKEKSVACSTLLQEKDLMEKSYKDQLNSLIAEKERVQSELDALRTSAKREEYVLSSKIIQLENDFVEELKERDEQLCEAEKNVQLLQENLEKLYREHKFEKEALNSKLLQSELLYKEACDTSERKKEEMFVEISRLQSTINELEKKISLLSKFQNDYKVLEREKFDLKNVVSQLQNSIADLEQEGDVLKNLKNVHEQTVKENVRLISEVAHLQNKLDLSENRKDKATMLIKQSQSEAQGFQNTGLPTEEGDQFGDIEDTNSEPCIEAKGEATNTQAEKMKDLETILKDTKDENNHLKNEVYHLQEQLNQLATDYDLGEKIGLEESVCPELEEGQISFPALKMLFAVAKKENLLLRENLKLMELKHEEAIQNNSELSTEVSWLQTEIQNMEEMAQASLKLESMYENAKQEKHELQILVSKLHERISELTGKSITKTFCVDKEIQTLELQLDHENIENHSAKNQEHFLREIHIQDLIQKYKIENAHLRANVRELESTCESLAQQKEELLGASLAMQKQVRLLGESAANSLTVHHDTVVEDLVNNGNLQILSPRRENIQAENWPVVVWDEQSSEIQKQVELLSFETKILKEENAALKTEITSLEEDNDICNQKIRELQETCEEMWVNLETVNKEKIAVQAMVESLSKQVSELKARNQQLDSENSELCQKNTKNQADVQDLNHRLMSLLKQKERKDAVKGRDEWQKERKRLKDELEGYRSKIADSEKESSRMKVHTRFLEQENTLLKQEIETKQLSKSSEVTDLKNEISGLINKKEKLLREKEALSEELNRCVEKCAKVGYLENKIANMKQEQKTWEQQSQMLKSQLTVSQEKIQGLEENLQSVNLQMSRIKSDLRVAQQEKEALRQEVMSLHKQLQNANAKIQVLEMAKNSSGLQNHQKKLYWDDLAQLMEQEQQLIRQENERLQREVKNAKSGLTQSREKILQLESTIISMKQQKHQCQSSMVKALEQEKSSLKRECEQLQKELISANRKVSQMGSLERDLESGKMENECLRTKQGTFDEQLKEMLHSASSVTHSHTPLQQQACVTLPREQYLQLQQQLQQADRRNQQLQAAIDTQSADTNSPQADQELLLRKMEERMMDVEQKLRIVKMLLKEKVNQLKEQFTRNTKTDAMIKDLYVDNSKLLKALEMSEQRHQTAEKKNYLLEEKIAGLSRIVRDLSPSAIATGLS
ncbi:ninein isoform X1 [Bombina bombina]|uniref:ninein isoform X1 n=1 Tax=Bombina bombina TaxID=8345 RepID=UPI00235A482F|nr:ninein isoform X1 [Bombina bombina]